MNRAAESVLALLLGGALLRISALSEDYLRYVKPGLRWPLIIAGALLVYTALRTLAREVLDSLPDPEGPAAETEEEHEGSPAHGGPLVAWLLILPVCAIVLVGPPALGSYSVDRSGATAIAKPSSDYPPLPAGDPIEVSLLDYVSRAVWDNGTSLRHRTLRMTGFVTTDAHGRVYLTRLVLTCCAADAQALRIVLNGDIPPGLDPDTWITVAGHYDPARLTDPVSQETVPTLALSSLSRVTAPSEPYDK
jgi:uncharacterized repeat protein (TIGR03943 family)